MLHALHFLVKYLCPRNIPENEKQSILHGPQTYMRTTTLPDLFYQIQRELGSYGCESTTSVVCKQTKVSLAQLNKQSNALARALLLRMESAEQYTDQPIVGLFVPSNEKRMISLLAILKTGAAYLPLDPVIPVQRMRFMLAEAKVKIVLCQSQEYRQILKKYGVSNFGVKVVDFDELMEKAIKRELSDLNITRQERFESLNGNPIVAVFYTSGSTGVPKGVSLRTKNVVNRIMWYWKQFPYSGSQEVGCHKTSIAFVDSVNEIFSCLLKAVPLVIIPSEVTQNPESLIDVLCENKVTRIVVVPSLLRMILEFARIISDGAEKLKSLSLVISGSEALTPDLARDFFAMFPDGHVLGNFFGSTETAGDVCFDVFKCVADINERVENGYLSVGRPMPNNIVYVMDGDMNVLPRGEVGEVWVSGRNVVDGYMGKSHSELFQKNEILTQDGHEVLYKIGDLGLVLDGVLYYQGRKDSQVKIRGHRVNLREVEMSIANIPGVDSVVVLSCEIGPQNQVPVACYLTRQKGQLTPGFITQECRKKLPEYMMPQVMLIDSFPMQPHTGKVDRQTLKKMYTQSIMGESDASGPDDAKRKLQAIIAKNTGRSESSVKLSDNFFAIGGNSISAVCTVVELNKAGLQVTMSELLSAKTVNDILRSVSDKKHHTCGLESEMRQKYSTVMLNSLPNKEDAIELVAIGFAEKNPLDIVMKTPVKSLVKLIRSFWSEICSDDLSMAVVENSTGKIVGANFILDARTQINPEFDIIEVAAINEAVEEPVKKEVLEQGGRWVDPTLTAVDVNLPDQSALALLQMMEEEVLQLAEQRGYDGIVTVNSHPVTMDMDEHMYGYEVRNSLHVRSFEYEGKRPFENADEDYYIKAMVKRLKGKGRIKVQF